MTAGRSPVVLAHSSSAPTSIIGHLESDRTQCLFLSQDYLNLLQWEAAIEGRGHLLKVGNELHSVATDLKQPFLDLIADLGRSQSTLAWWVSRLSERNPLVSPLFLHCCYLQLGVAHLDKVDCIISESWAVLESIANTAQKRSIEIVWASRRPKLARSLPTAGRSLMRVMRFLLKSLKNRRLGSRVEARLDKPLALLRTWPDQACFTEAGTFRDRYLPGLKAWLIERGFSVLTIPLHSSGLTSKTKKRLRKSTYGFLIPETYYHLTDYLFAIYVLCKPLFRLRGPMLLRDLEVKSLFEEESKRSSFDTGSLEAALSYRLPKRLAEAEVKVDIVIDAFENMIPEKAFILGFRRYQPWTHLVGFQHGALYPLNLCNFISRRESDYAPMPDRVVSNGPLFRDILIDQGLPSDKVVSGPALRYQHLFIDPKKRNEASSDGFGKTVVVALPLTENACSELLLKTVEAFEHQADLRVLLKPHPMANSLTALRSAQIDNLPKHFEFPEGELKDLLDGADLVLSLSSSAIHESLAAGVPVLTVGREVALDLNPLGWDSSLGRVFRDPAKIRQETLRLLSLSPQELADYRTHSQSQLEQSFGPTNDRTMQAFTAGLNQ